MPSPSSEIDSNGATELLMRMTRLTISRPFDPFRLVYVNRWQLCTYTTFSRLLVMDVSEMKTHFSDRAFTFYSHHSKAYFIVYNSDLPYKSVCYGIAHEIGHIVWGHVSPKVPYNQAFSQSTYQNELEADRFAQYLFEIYQEDMK